MIVRILAGLLVILNACSFPQHESKTGLKIENGPNRGLNYTDPLGSKYSYRYITATITNDSTISIHLQIALSNEYNYPAAYGDQKFKVFLLPKELTPDIVTFDTLSYELGNNELRNFFDKGLNPPYILNETLEPGEKCVITMGTLYPQPTNCGVVPKVLFAQSDGNNFQACDSQIYQAESANSQLTFGIKLNFCSGCVLIPCGQISYPER